MPAISDADTFAAFDGKGPRDSDPGTAAETATVGIAIADTDACAGDDEAVLAPAHQPGTNDALHGSDGGESVASTATTDSDSAAFTDASSPLQRADSDTAAGTDTAKLAPAHQPGTNDAGTALESGAVNSTVIFDTDFASGDGATTPTIGVSSTDTTNALYVTVVTDTDSGTGADNGGFLYSDSDAGTGSDNSLSINAALSDVELVLGTDDGFSFALSDTDTATGADTELQPGVPFRDTDTAALADAGSFSATLSDTELIASAINEAINASPRSDTDTATAAETEARTVLLSDADTASATDLEQTTIQNSDTSTSTEAQTLQILDIDTATGIDNGSRAGTPQDEDHFSALEAATIHVTLTDRDSFSITEGYNYDIPQYTQQQDAPFTIVMAAILTPGQGTLAGTLYGVRDGTITLNHNQYTLTSNDTQLGAWTDITDADVAIASGYLPYAAANTLLNYSAGADPNNLVLDLSLYPQQPGNTPVPVLLRAHAQNHFGQYRTVDIILYSVLFTSFTAQDTAIRQGLTISWAGKAIRSATDEFGGKLPSPAIGRILSQPGAIESGTLSGWQPVIQVSPTDGDTLTSDINQSELTLINATLHAADTATALDNGFPGTSFALSDTDTAAGLDAGEHITTVSNHPTDTDTATGTESTGTSSPPTTIHLLALTATGTTASPNRVGNTTPVGAYANATNRTISANDADGNVGRSMAYGMQKMYYQQNADGSGKFPTGFVDGTGTAAGDITAIVNAGARIWLCHQPNMALTLTDLNAYKTAVQWWLNHHPLGADGVRVVAGYQEPQNASWGFNPNPNAPASPGPVGYITLVAYYIGGVGTGGQPGVGSLTDPQGNPVVCVYDAAGHAPNQWVSWCPDAYVQEVVMDYYAVADFTNQIGTASGTGPGTIDPTGTLRAHALSIGAKYGFGEIGSAIIPQYATSTQFTSFITYVQDVMTGNTATAKLTPAQRADVAWYNCNRNDPNVNTLSGTTQPAPNTTTTGATITAATYQSWTSTTTAGTINVTDGSSFNQTGENMFIQTTVGVVVIKFGSVSGNQLRNCTFTGTLSGNAGDAGDIVTGSFCSCRAFNNNQTGEYRNALLRTFYDAVTVSSGGTQPGGAADSGGVDPSTGETANETPQTGSQFQLTGICGGGTINVHDQSPEGVWAFGGDTDGEFFSYNQGDNQLCRTNGMQVINSQHAHQCACIQWSKTESGSGSYPRALYACTGDGNSGGGFLATLDEGHTWTLRSSAVQYAGNSASPPAPSGAGDPRSTRRLLAQDAAGGYFYTATYSNGIWRSPPGSNGAAWTSMGFSAGTTVYARSICLDDTDPTTVYATFYGNGAYKAQGNARTLTGTGSTGWTKLNTSPHVIEELCVLEGIVYAACGGSGQAYSGTDVGFYRSPDGGGTWQQLNGTTAQPGFLNTATSYWESVDAYKDPNTGNHVVILACGFPVSGRNVVKAVCNSTGTGSPVFTDLTGTINNTNLPPDGRTTWVTNNLHNLMGEANSKNVFVRVDRSDPTFNTIVFSGQAGAWRCLNAQAGTSARWDYMVNGMSLFWARSWEVDPQDANKGILTDSDWTSFQFTDLQAPLPGQSTSTLQRASSPSFPEGLCVAYDTGLTPSQAYMGGSGKYSAVGGDVVTKQSGQVGNWVSAGLKTSINPTSPGQANAVLGVWAGRDGSNHPYVIAATQGNGMWRWSGSTTTSVPGASATWTQVSNACSSTSSTPSGPHLSFTGDGNALIFAFDHKLGIWRSTNSGTSWTQIWSASASPDHLGELWLNPTVANELWIAADPNSSGDSGLYKVPNANTVGTINPGTNATAVNNLPTAGLQSGKAGPLTIAPGGAHGKVYVAMASTTTGNGTALVCSTDGGTTWQSAADSSIADVASHPRFLRYAGGRLFLGVGLNCVAFGTPSV